MCRFEPGTVSFTLNIGSEIDLESWRRKLDIFNEGRREFLDFFSKIEFNDDSVDIFRDHNLYTIYRNGDIYFSFDPYKDFYGHERRLEETIEKSYDDLVRENLSEHIQSLTRFLRRNGLDIPSKFIVKEVSRGDNLVPDRRDRDKGTCYINLERFEMMYENKMDIENKGTYLIIKFKSIHPNLKITVILGNLDIGGYARGIVESLDQTPIDVLSDEGFSIISDYLTHLSSALYRVKKAVEEIKAYEFVSKETIVKEAVERNYKLVAELLSKELYGDDYEQWVRNKDLIEQMAKKLIEILYSGEKLIDDDERWP